MLEISILKPDLLVVSVTASPDGTINFPCVGSVTVLGKTVFEAREPG